MKWKNKGRELDGLISKLVDERKMKVHLFGYGEIAKLYIETLYANDYLAGFIDNDTKKQGKMVCEKQIISLDSFLELKEQRDSIIVITASISNKKNIERQLRDNGLIYGKDYFYYTEFFNRIFPILMAYQKNRSFVSLAQISLTERCTLKCKKCAHACYAVSNDSEDLSLSEVYKSADSFFSKVDYIQEFVLIGGEPLLYKQLTDAIEYIGSKYRNRMNIFCITTNGTIVPEKDVLELCKKYHILFRISNYTNQLPKLEKHHEKLCTCLDTYGVDYILGKQETEWVDYGFEDINRDCSEEELIKIFSACNTPCREIRGNKYYYCVMARTVSENLGFGVGQDDYLDFDTLTSENYKKELLEFNLGYSEKGYLDMCKHCRGNDAKNYPIPAAEQLER